MPVASKKYMTKASSDRLDRILQAASERLTRDGVEALTIRSLAKDSRVSPNTLYNRFGSKDNIVSLVVIESFNRNIDLRERSVRDREAPFDHLLTLIGLLEHELRDKRAFSQALMVLHFKHDNDRDLPDTVYQMLQQRLLASVRDMELVRELVPWASSGKIASELADRVLGTSMKWTQNAFPDKELLPNLRFSVLSTLHAFVIPRLQKRITELLRDLAVQSAPAKGKAKAK